MFFSIFVTKTAHYVLVYKAVLTVFILYIYKFKALTQFKSLAGQTKSYKDATNIVVSRIKEGVNTPSTHSVNEKKERVEPVKITFASKN